MSYRCVLATLIILFFVAETVVVAAAPKPLRALLVCGGCCHDYTEQKRLIADGLKARAFIEVDAVQQGGTRTDSKIELYENPDWAKGYDVILHNECFSDAADTNWTARILKPHREGLPAVVIHCAMHTYRDKTDEWFKFLGVTSHGHGAPYPHEVLTRDGTHPIMKTLGPGWWNPAGELYHITKLWPTAHPLASTKNQESGKEEICVWANDYSGTKLFGTTLGHHNETVARPEFLDLLTRGTLWAAGKLNDGYLKSAPRSPEGTNATKNTAALKDVKIPAEFEMSLFASAPAVNYPVFVAASPDGTVYVSSDKNGSLDKKPYRGRVLRVRDLDNDGSADEVKMFVPNVDSPRGLVWDHDRLYLLHPPHLSAFIDHDGDGIADEQKILVKNIAFTFKDRPADHSSNGIELGIDGWLYCAIGDFGFMEAEGTDGRKLQLRGGGVVRVRPDGTGLELYSRGTRNILEVALSPTLEGFARDNTNDGDGWDIRLHHFTGLSSHGYPSLYKNFRGEAVEPLADYGGGSGCGAMFLSEPGMPEGFNDALYTADWGREWIYRHRLTPKGATFSADQTEFVRLPRVTDLDADAMGNIYAASWKGASFTYVGEDVGFLVRLRPKNFRAEPLPDFNKLNDEALVALFKSPSHRRRLEAQRVLLRRGIRPTTAGTLLKLAQDFSASEGARVAAVFTLKQGLRGEATPLLIQLWKESPVGAFAIRALADDLRDIEDVPSAVFASAVLDPDPRTLREAAFGLSRLKRPEQSRLLGELLRDSDLRVRHTAVQALIELKARDVCFGLIDQEDASITARLNAFQVLQALHEPEVVEGLVGRLDRKGSPSLHRALITALCRLHMKEGVWKGDSWGTRPDTSGPYYQAEEWNETQRILATLEKMLPETQGDEMHFVVSELARHKIHSETIILRVLQLAEKDGQFVFPALRLVSLGDRIPDAALPLLVRSARGNDDDVRTEAIVSLSKMARPPVLGAILDALPLFKETKGRHFERARTAFFNSSKISVEDLASESAKREGARSAWADAMLLRMSGRRNNNSADRDAAKAITEKSWAETGARVQLLEAVRLAEHRAWADRVLEARSDADDAVSKAAERTTLALKLERDKKKTAPESTLDKMKTDVVIAAVAKTKGDRTLGADLFAKQTCASCHTVRQSDPLRGPYLGNISTLYKRQELAEAILVPNKSLAQGFVSYQFELKDGSEMEGFVVQESAAKTTIRNVTGLEIELKNADVAKRTKLDRSLMPEGLVGNLTLAEFASLLDFLEAGEKP